MSIEKAANERLELYERFKQTLKNPDDDRFFDADELVIVFDQAVDLDDLYVQVEVLLRGYRFFPDNEELATRRGLFYSDMDINDGVSDLVETHNEGSPMWDILGFKKLSGSKNPEAAIKILNEILEKPVMFDDETAIRIVNLARSNEAYNWLLENETALRGKTEYLPSLLYEMAIAAEFNDDLATAVRLLEELTELEPFNIDFWVYLAQILTEVPDFEGALSACDYALAISSEDQGALMTKASILCTLKRYKEVLELVEPFISQDPLSRLGEYKIRALLGLKTEADVKQIKEYAEALCKAHPDDYQLMALAVELRTDNVEDIVIQYFRSQPGADSTQSHEFGRNLYQAGDALGASIVFSAILKNEGSLDSEERNIFHSALYAAKRYDRLVELFETQLETDPQAISPDLAIAGLMSYLFLGREEDCKNALQRLINSFPLNLDGDWIISSTLRTIGFSSFISTLNSMLQKGGRVDFDILDIFHLPEGYNPDRDIIFR